jgi:hypothetical protein
MTGISKNARWVAVIAVAATSSWLACGGSVQSPSTADDAGADAPPVDGRTPDAPAADATKGDAPSDASDGGAHDAVVERGSPGTSDGGAFVATYTSSDPLNATPPVLARLSDGVVLAGASADPATVGVSDFGDAGRTSEAFVSRWSHSGTPMWSKPLEAAAGMPVGIAVDPSSNILVAAPYVPGVENVEPYSVGQSVYLAKLGADGTLLYEKEVTPVSGLTSDDSLSVGGLAVDSTGAIAIVGSVVQGAVNLQSIFLAKYDPTGTQLWSKTFPGDPSKEMEGTAVTISGSADEIVITGEFEGNVNFGGGLLASELDGGFQAFGFLARFASSGTYIGAVSFGGLGFNFGTALAPAGTTDVLLAGNVAGSASVGGKAITGDPNQGTAFLARVDRSGQASWASLIGGGGMVSAGVAFSVDATRGVQLTGSFGGSLLVASYAAADGSHLTDVTATVSDAGAGVRGSGIATDSTGSLWVSGAFDTHATIGSVTLNGPTAGVFIVRLDH